MKNYTVTIWAFQVSVKWIYYVFPFYKGDRTFTQFYYNPKIIPILHFFTRFSGHSSLGGFKTQTHIPREQLTFTHRVVSICALVFYWHIGLKALKEKLRKEKYNYS